MKKPTETEILHIPIAAFLNRYPQASRVLIRNRMWCIGCAFARFHTLKDVIEIYQLGEETFFEDVRGFLDLKDDLDPSMTLFEETSG
jgi:hybrid cluster-associated redox disulfide protein